MFADFVYEACPSPTLLQAFGSRVFCCRMVGTVDPGGSTVVAQLNGLLRGVSAVSYTDVCNDVAIGSQSGPHRSVCPLGLEGGSCSTHDSSLEKAGGL